MRWMVLLVLASCGRIGFAPVIDGDGGLGDDGNVLGDRPMITSNIVFVTRGNLSPGSFGGLAGADAICNMQAQQNNQPGTYVAYLSSSTVDAITRLNGARGWTRPDGTPFADTPNDISTGRIFSTPMYQPDGTRASSGAYWVVTATTGTGTKDAAGTCTDYSSTSGLVRIGRATATGTGFSTWSTGADCSMGERIYCFGIDRNVPVAAPTSQVVARRAFLSSPWMSGGGLASADARCQADAMAAGITTGTFHALLASSTTSAASRFDGAGLPWARLDGILLAPTASALLTNALREPLNLTAGGQYLGDVGNRVWTGASDAQATTNASTCNDWTSTVNGQTGDLGEPEFSDLYWFFGSSQTCSNTARLYCLEI